MKILLLAAAAWFALQFALHSADPGTLPVFTPRLIREAGEPPAQPADRPVEVVEQEIRKRLRDPSSEVIYRSIIPLREGQTPGGAPCYVTHVTWRGVDGRPEWTQETFFIKNGKIFARKFMRTWPL